jgi:hypothetical protein
MGLGIDPQLATNGRLPAVGQHLAQWPRGLYIFFFQIFSPPILHFLCMWSTMAGWLQHMPTLPKLLLKTSNTHNF